MNISGTITEAGQASPPSGQFNVRYQDIVITDSNNRKWYGRIGSKQGYQGGEQITVSIEQKADSDGNTYNYLKRFNPQYSQPNQPPQAGQPPQNRPEPQNGQKEMRIVRGNALNAVMSAVDVPSDMIGEYLLTGVQFILTGEWTLQPKNYQKSNQPMAADGRPIDDDIPF
ncbi:unnamed protein product [marine sediment metagenome]|uniref:Uncharacterized protein n=1 Tax=marine sediment metagenome TaxID=412755 RepID=X1A4W5_9ZZZZ